jgi:hypothetical protein
LEDELIILAYRTQREHRAQSASPPLPLALQQHSSPSPLVCCRWGAAGS